MDTTHPSHPPPPPQGGVLHNISRPVLRVDPEGRCAVMLAYGTHLAVLPFRHDTSVLDDQEGAESASSPTHGYMYIRSFW